ncbi:hypothetical protein ACE6ED_03380 [Paenibacillus sp. CN-4]|uniref:hypothetical protein n=1 Tax=Paenibacillus nanchangensis TaxID=3348343 RepID=UPI00397B74AE
MPLPKNRIVPDEKNTFAPNSTTVFIAVPNSNVDGALRQKDLLIRLQNVSYSVFQKERKRWTARLEEAMKRRRFLRNPQKYLSEAESR